MLGRISKLIASWCYTITQKGDIEITAYGIEVLLDTLTKLVAFILIAIFFGCLQEMLIVLVVFSSLRFFAGGFHMRSNLGCFMSMLLIFVFSICLEKFFIFNQVVIPRELLAFVFLTLIGVVFLYAPSTTLNNPIKDKSILHKKKFYSVLLSGVLSFVTCFMPGNTKVLILVPFLCEVVTILPIVNYKSIREEE